MMLFRFREFPVYRSGLNFRSAIYAVSQRFPKDELFALTAQTRRAIISVLLNIAEGSNRLSDQDFGRFLNQSLTSLEEVVACLDIAQEAGYLSTVEHGALLQQAEGLGKQLIAFSAKLRSDEKGMKF